MVIIVKNIHETHRYHCPNTSCNKFFKTEKSFRQHSCLRENNQVINLKQDDRIIEEEIQNLKERESRLIFEIVLNLTPSKEKNTRNRFDRIDLILKNI